MNCVDGRPLCAVLGTSHASGEGDCFDRTATCGECVWRVALSHVKLLRLTEVQCDTQFAKDFVATSMAWSGWYGGVVA